jgi:NADH-quinone oxidoreductase subunit M
MSGLMKVIPFASICYVIAGLASLGLPGLSGFVAEMTIFVGAFAKQGVFYTVLTIIAACSIVITAVYILRTIAIILHGPVKKQEHISLADATWYEKVSVVGLIIGIVALGIFPAFFANIINM